MNPGRPRFDRSRPPLKPLPKPEGRSFLARVNNFLESRQKQPLWGFAGWFFLLCAPFAAVFFYNAPDWRANFDQQGVIFDRAKAAGDDFLHIEDLILAAATSARSAVANYKTTLEGKNVGGPLDQQKLVQGTDLIRVALNQIGVAKAALSNVDFPDATLNTYSKALVSDFQNQQTKFEIMRRLYVAVLQSDAPSNSAARTDLQKDTDGADAVNEAILGNVGHFIQEGDRFQEQTQIDVARFTKKRFWFYVYQMLARGAAIYSAVFFVVLLCVLANRLLKSDPRA